YVTLSHCWGGRYRCDLRKDTYIGLRAFIPITKLGRNFQHAITITRQLEIHYLWIGSL
ncbi:hypothetical protein K469DRAFT_537459, partial [Zopfia rhizophila CBS 207.26]